MPFQRRENRQVGHPIVAAPRPDGMEQDVWDVPPYMLPDENDCMEVLAGCGTHFVNQPRTELLAGIPAYCARCDPSRERTCKQGHKYHGKPGAGCNRCRYLKAKAKAKSRKAGTV